MEVKEDNLNHRLLEMLEAFRKASKDLQNNSIFVTHNNPESAIEALLQLQSEADSVLSTDPKFSKLSHLLCTLKTLLQKQRRSHGFSLKSFLYRQINNYRIYQVAFSIEAEVQACIDRETIQNIVKISQETDSESEEDKLRILKRFEKRLLMGFDSEFQELVLRAKGFSILESLLYNSTCSNRIKELAAFGIVALVKFNKDVFVGLVLKGPIVQSLISMASGWSIQVLCSLIKLIKTPLIDEIELDGEIPRIISLFSLEDLSIQVSAMNCICEIAYFGRKEVIEAMIEHGLIEKLVELQRSVHGNHQCNGETCEEGDESGIKFESKEGEIVKNRPFESCVTRFSVQIEVGEGLNQKEKTKFKREILRRVREASASEAEAASIVAEVLWGSNS